MDPSEDARGFCQRFFHWYNNAQHHSGIGFHPVADIHYGRAVQRRATRAKALAAACASHPDRFVRKPQEPPHLPDAAWINRPTQEIA